MTLLHVVNNGSFISLYLLAAFEDMLNHVVSVLILEQLFCIGV